MAYALLALVGSMAQWMATTTTFLLSLAALYILSATSSRGFLLF